MMRIIAGTARGRKLKGPDDSRIRPALDRVREAYFSIIGPGLHNTRFLDCCAGTGAVGIEALSRGADKVVFIEKSADAADLIRTNLSLCGFDSDWNIVKSEVLKGIEGLSMEADVFDNIFFGPPYDMHDLYGDFLGSSHLSGLLKNDSLLAVQHENKTPVEDRYGGLARTRIKKYGQTCLSFYRPAS